MNVRWCRIVASVLGLVGAGAYGLVWARVAVKRYTKTGSASWESELAGWGSMVAVPGTDELARSPAFAFAAVGLAAALGFGVAAAADWGTRVWEWFLGCLAGLAVAAPGALAIGAPQEWAKLTEARIAPAFVTRVDLVWGPYVALGAGLALAATAVVCGVVEQLSSESLSS